MTKNAVPFNITNNARNFQSDSRKCQIICAGNFQKIPIDFRKGSPSGHATGCKVAMQHLEHGFDLGLESGLWKTKGARD